MQITITSSSPTSEIEVEKYLKKEENILIFEAKLCKFGSKCKKDSCRYFHAKIKKNKIVVKRKQVKFGFFICQSFETGDCKHQSNCEDLHCEIKENLKIFKTQCNVTPILAFGAGILPFSLTDENEVYFLMGKEKKNKYVWCDFGGGYSAEDKSPLFTAAREAAEETMGLIGRNLDEITEDILTKENLAISVNYLEGLLMRKKGVYHHLIEEHKYHQFICHIPWVDEELLNQAIVVNRKKDYKLRHVEKLQYKWVKGVDLLKMIEQFNENKLDGVGINNDGKIESIRKSSISSLKIIYPSIKEIVEKFSN
jgi:hypothetical protein